MADVKNLVGTDADQVPLNGDLGTLAYQNADGLTLKDQLYIGDHANNALLTDGSLRLTGQVPQNTSAIITGRAGSRVQSFWSAQVNRGTGAEWSSGYLHLLLNTGGDAMFRIDAQGYSYGTSHAIDTTAVGYNYNGSGTIINAQVVNHSGGNCYFHTVYRSQSNQVVAVLYSSSWYVTQFHLDGWFWSDDPQVEDWAMSASATGAF